MNLLDPLTITFNCPACDYGVDVKLQSVRMEETIICPCCKRDIRLVDEGSSLHIANAEIESTLNEFKRELKKFNKSIKFKL